MFFDNVIKNNNNFILYKLTSYLKQFLNNIYKINSIEFIIYLDISDIYYYETIIILLRLFIMNLLY